MNIKRIPRGDHESETTVYCSSPVGRSETFHADLECPHLSEVSHVWAHTLPSVLKSWAEPTKPCEYCTQDLATCVRVAVDHDGAPPHVLSVGRRQARVEGVLDPQNRRVMTDGGRDRPGRLRYSVDRLGGGVIAAYVDGDLVGVGTSAELRGGPESAFRNPDLVTDGGRDRLDGLSDEELGALVRKTPAFRAAAACSRFADEARELRENDALAFDRLVRETHDRQGTSVSVENTTRSIVTTFLDVVEDHAELAQEPAEAADDAAGELALDNGGDAA